MKLHPKAIAFATLIAAVGTVSARAIPIQVVYSPVTTQPADNGLATVATWASDAITTFNSNGYPGAPLPGLGDLQFKITPDGVSDGTAPAGWPNGFPAGTTTSISLPLGGFDYLVLSWGGSLLPGDNGTADYLYYIGGTSGVVTFDQPSGARGGLSGIMVYGTSSVPDAAATAVLLALGIGALAIRRRQRCA